MSGQDLTKTPLWIVCYFTAGVTKQEESQQLFILKIISKSQIDINSIFVYSCQKEK